MMPERPPILESRPEGTIVTVSQISDRDLTKESPSDIIAAA